MPAPSSNQQQNIATRLASASGPVTVRLLAGTDLTGTVAAVAGGASGGAYSINTGDGKVWTFTLDAVLAVAVTA